MNGLAIAMVVGGMTLGAVSSGCAQQQPVAPAAAVPSGEFKTVDELLTALEKADEKMESLTADLVYDRTFEIQGDRQVRKGKLYFENRGEKGKRFAIKFDELWIGDVVRREELVFIFDGEWFIEKNFKDKNMIKRQVAAPGEKFDPLKIGEGPLPIPLGQKKADVLLRFVATLMPVGEGLGAAADANAGDKAEADERLKHVSGSTQVKLEPKPDFVRETEFKEVRLWYRRDGSGNLLPVMARTINKNGDVSVVQLSKAQMQMAGAKANPGAAVPAGVMDAKAPEGWDVRVDQFRKPVER